MRDLPGPSSECGGPPAEFLFFTEGPPSREALSAKRKCPPKNPEASAGRGPFFFGLHLFVGLKKNGTQR